MARTGIGSNNVLGVHSGISSTSEMMAFARVGEQIKWRTAGRASEVPSKSLGVIRTRGVRYSNLQDN